jgi:hypothetical protein
MSMQQFMGQKTVRKNAINTNLLAVNIATGTNSGGVTTGFLKDHSETLSSSTDQSFNGTKSLKCICPGSVSEEGTYYITSSLTPSLSYTQKFYIKGTQGVEMKIYLQEFNGGSLVGNTISYPVLTGGWDEVSSTRSFGATGNKATVYIATKNQTATTFYIGQAILRKGTY